MKTALLILLSVSMAVAVTEIQKSPDSKPKDKRGVSAFGVPGYDVFGGTSAFGSSGWAPVGYAADGWASPDAALGQIQLQATHDIALQALRDLPMGTPSIAYPPEVIRAIQQAKDASRNVLVAQQRVADAKQAAHLQQKIAIAKEANAREAAHRSQEIAAHAIAEARASARQLVASQQRLATLKDAVAAAQRVAAAREAAAAAAIQRTATATAAELKKQDVDKQISISEEEARQKDIVAAKENAIANALQHAAAEKPSYPPWG
ncbi:tol-Pal system protein TolA [Neodiprion pinetum]|uniref:tol-Pal system protein TolA n=1 Tax=Neodiprion pinetum TaxID=441929 RepID=UPI001EDDB8D9|nr:nuclease SbcCD subunit C-like [Neodiprion pinetum]